jgi:sulfur carrier protein
VTVQVHGRALELRPGATVRELLRALARGEEGVAVAVNLQVVPRTRFAEHELKEGDRVDLVTAVGGG